MGLSRAERSEKTARKGEWEMSAEEEESGGDISRNLRLFHNKPGQRVEWRDEECGVKERKRGGGAQNGTREEAGGREGRSDGRGRVSIEGEDERDGRRESL